GVARVDAITNLKPEEIDRYLHDPAYKAKLNNIVEKEMEGPEQILAKRTLAKISQINNKPPYEMPKMDAEDKVLYDLIHEVPATKAIKDYEALLADKNVRARLNGPENKMSGEDKILYEGIQNSLFGALQDQLGGKTAYMACPSYMNALLKYGSLGLQSK